MTTPTPEIQRAYAEAWFRTFGMDEDDVQRAVEAELREPMPWRLAALQAVLAIVERDRTAGSPTEKRAALDAAIADALPISGGKIRKRLKQLRRALADGDEVRKQREPCTRPNCGHILAWHQHDGPPGCVGDLMHCRCEGWLP